MDELMKQFRVNVPADLQPLMLENVKAGGNSKAVMKLLNPYLNAVSALPLARDVRKELLDILRRFSDKDPMPVMRNVCFSENVRRCCFPPFEPVIKHWKEPLRICWMRRFRPFQEVFRKSKRFLMKNVRWWYENMQSSVSCCFTVWQWSKNHVTGTIQPFWKGNRNVARNLPGKRGAGTSG